MCFFISEMASYTLHLYPHNNSYILHLWAFESCSKFERIIFPCKCHSHHSQQQRRWKTLRVFPSVFNLQSFTTFSITFVKKWLRKCKQYTNNIYIFIGNKTNGVQKYSLRLHIRNIVSMADISGNMCVTKLNIPKGIFFGLCRTLSTETCNAPITLSNSLDLPDFTRTAGKCFKFKGRLFWEAQTVMPLILQAWSQSGNS